MNDSRRRKITKALKLIEEANTIIEDVAEEEADALSNFPESLEGTDKYMTCEEANGNLEEAVSAFEDLIGYLESARDGG